METNKVELTNKIVAEVQMPNIIGVETAVPQYSITQKEAKKFAKYLFNDKFKDLDRLLGIFDNTQIEKRHFCVPIEWFKSSHSFEEKNKIYIHNAINLAKEAINNLLRKNSLDLKLTNHVYYVSSTGISTPSIDAHLFNLPEFNFDPHLKRTPIWGLGCAGGAAGLARAYEYVLAFPKEIALVIALEIGELAFFREDFSKSNFIASSLFADGAAAVLVAGDEVKTENRSFNSNIKIHASISTIWKGSLDVMGWDVQNEGLKVIFSKDIPTIIRKDLKDSVDYFLDINNLSYKDIVNYVLHPGGAKVIEAYQDVFNIPDNKLNECKAILKQYGNMSSPTVLFVLKEIIEQNSFEKGYGLLLALGPGFSAEIILLEWV